MFAAHGYLNGHLTALSLCIIMSSYQTLLLSEEIQNLPNQKTNELPINYIVDLTA